MNKQVVVIGIALIFQAVALSGCIEPSVEKDKKGNNPPTCSLSASPSTGNVPLIVSFSMFATDTDGSISSWELDVNDDGVSEYSGSGNPPTKKEHIFENLGTYTAKLTVTDNNNTICTTTKIIILSKEYNNPPICSLSAYPSTGNVPLIVAFSMTAIDTDGSISSWELDVNDDGVSEYSGLGNPPTTMEHIYGNLGTYTAKLTVKDNNDATCTTTRIIIVSVDFNTPPICTLNAVPNTGNVPLTVTFMMIATDTDGSISSWELDVNDDGVSEYSGSVSPPTTMEHIYGNLGTYTAKLTVKDNNDATCTTTKIIIVS